MVEITLTVPESLAEQLARVHTRLPEVLALGLEDLSPLPNEVYRYILEFLVSHPSAQAIRQFGPPSEMQERVSTLLEHQRSGQLTPREAAELDEYVRIDHLITLLKARVFPFVPAVP